MRISVGSDERTALADAVVDDLRGRGREVELAGPLSGEALQWAKIAETARGARP
jgi:hypothetical protein